MLIYLHISFHLDHCGALPWFLQKTSFKGRTFMTHATKAIYRWLLSDYVKVRYEEKRLLHQETLFYNVTSLFYMLQQHFCGRHAIH